MTDSSSFICEIDNINIPGWCLRQASLDASLIQRMAESIGRVGMLHPVVVWRDADGRLTLLDGLNRLVALRHLELDTVLVRQMDLLDEGQAMKARRDANTWLDLNAEEIAKEPHRTKLAARRDRRRAAKEQGV